MSGDDKPPRRQGHQRKETKFGLASVNIVPVTLSLWRLGGLQLVFNVVLTYESGGET